MRTLNEPRLFAAAGLLLLAAGLLWGAFRHEKPERLPPDWVPVNDRLAAVIADDGDGVSHVAPDAGGQAGAGGGQSNTGRGLSGAGGGQADAGGGRSAVGGGQSNAGGGHSTLDGGQSSAGGWQADAGGGRSGAVADTAPTPVQPDASGEGSPIGSAGFDINRATEADWDELPGIGPSKARAIVEDRERNGPFRSIDDLARVKGIGPKLLERLREAIEARNAPAG